MNITEQSSEVERLRAIVDHRQQELHNAETDLRTCESELLTVNVDKLITARLRVTTLQEIVTLATQRLERADLELAAMRRQTPFKPDPAIVAQQVRTLQGTRDILQRRIGTIQAGGHLELEWADTLNRSDALRTLQERLAAIDARLATLAVA